MAEGVEDNRFPAVYAVFLFGEGVAAFRQDAGHILADGRGAGQAGGFDARQVEEAGNTVNRPNDEVIYFSSSTYPSEIADCFTQVKGRGGAHSLVDHKL